MRLWSRKEMSKETYVRKLHDCKKQLKGLLNRIKQPQHPQPYLLGFVSRLNHSIFEVKVYPIQGMIILESVESLKIKLIERHHGQVINVDFVATIEDSQAITAFFHLTCRIMPHSEQCARK